MEQDDARQISRDPGLNSNHEKRRNGRLSPTTPNLTAFNTSVFTSTPKTNHAASTPSTRIANEPLPTAATPPIPNLASAVDYRTGTVTGTPVSATNVTSANHAEHARFY